MCLKLIMAFVSPLSFLPATPSSLFCFHARHASWLWSNSKGRGGGGRACMSAGEPRFSGVFFFFFKSLNFVLLLVSPRSARIPPTTRKSGSMGGCTPPSSLLSFAEHKLGSRTRKLNTRHPVAFTHSSLLFSCI